MPYVHNKCTTYCSVLFNVSVDPVRSLYVRLHNIKLIRRWGYITLIPVLSTSCVALILCVALVFERCEASFVVGVVLEILET
jgi:hypothetical protein